MHIRNSIGEYISLFSGKKYVALGIKREPKKNIHDVVQRRLAFIQFYITFDTPKMHSLSLTSISRPYFGNKRQSTILHHSRTKFIVNALPLAVNPNVIIDIAEKAAPGSVDAPIGAIIGGAVLVTAASLLLSLGLKPGTDAAIKMQERDAKSGRYRK